MKTAAQRTLYILPTIMDFVFFLWYKFIYTIHSNYIKTVSNMTATQLESFIDSMKWNFSAPIKMQVFLMLQLQLKRIWKVSESSETLTALNQLRFSNEGFWNHFKFSTYSLVRKISHLHLGVFLSPTTNTCQPWRLLRAFTVLVGEWIVVITIHFSVLATSVSKMSISSRSWGEYHRNAHMTLYK